jgi:hypothetical protein
VSTPNGGYQHNEELRARLQAFSPDEPGVVFPFSARLARESGWTKGFAERVMEEYRRFLYLAMTAGHPVSPSVEVDQAWHQHLTYTRSYWDDLCGRVLGRPLHHEPTKGGKAEGDKFVDWYGQTLDSYRAAFGQEPPRDIWPAPAERFAKEARIVQVSGATHWIIRKPRLPRRIGTALAGIAAVLLVAACAGDAEEIGVMGAVLLGVVLIMGAIVSGGRSAQPPRRHLRHDARARNAGTTSGGGGWVWMSGDSGSNCDSSDGGSCGDGGGCGGGGCGGGGCGGCG